MRSVLKVLVAAASDRGPGGVASLTAREQSRVWTLAWLGGGYG